MDIETLDLEVVDQEMAADKASQSATAAPASNTSRDAPLPPSTGDNVAAP